jgi:molybdate transport system regulatory protein
VYIIAVTMKDPVIRFRIDFSQANNLGPGKIALLEAIQAAGSISDAARTLKMSYRRAWLLASSLNSAFIEPVVVSATGGKGGGGAQVTAFGASLIAHYRALEREIELLGKQRLAEILPHVAHEFISHVRPARRALAKKVTPAPRKS